MEARAAPPPELIEDVRFALEYRRDCAIDLRSALLHHFKNWPKGRLLGPPFELGLADRPDSLGQFVDRVALVGGASRHLEGVRNAGAELDHCAESYKKGLMAGVALAVWRADIERFYAGLIDALDAANIWLAEWGEASVRRAPNLVLLDQQELLSTEDLAKVLGIGAEAAARRRRAGEFGEVVGKGQRKFVRSSNVRKALGLTLPPTQGD